jgi:RNA polymerase sigma factor (TIGR02999 family)
MEPSELNSARFAVYAQGPAKFHHSPTHALYRFSQTATGADGKIAQAEQGMAAASVTGLLIDWGNGDRGALDRLMPLVYEELRGIARHHLSLEAPQTLQSTALVHEAYIRLIDQNRVQWRDRAHFFAVAARLIRRILLDHARRRHAEKRGGSAQKLTLIDAAAPSMTRDVDVIALDDALQSLAELDPTQAQVVELRFFAGLTIIETAEALGISTATVERDWVTARAWLFDALKQTDRPAVVE